MFMQSFEARLATIQGNEALVEEVQFGSKVDVWIKEDEE